MSRQEQDHRLRRRLIVTATIVQWALGAALLAWRAGEWNQRGWTGLSYVSVFERLPDRPLTGFLADVDGAVLMVAADSPAARAGIATGDVVVSVDGVAAGDLPGLWRLAGRKRLGERLTFDLRTASGRQRIEVPLESPLGRFGTLLGMASSFLAGTAFLVLSLLVYRPRPRSRSAFVFFLVGSLGAALFFIGSASHLDVPDLRGVVPMGAQPLLWAWLGLYTLLGLAVTNLLLHLSLVFPRPRPIAARRPAVFRWLHTLPFLPLAALAVALGTLIASQRGVILWALEITAAAAAALLVRRLVRGRDGGLRDRLLAHPLQCQLLLLVAVAAAAPAIRLLPPSTLPALILFGWFGLVVFLFVVVTVYSLITCAAFLRSYRESGEEEKQQLSWPFWGTTVALAGITLLTLAALAVRLSPAGPDPAILPWIHAANRLLYPLIPASFACGILGYRLPFRRRAPGAPS